MPYVTASIILQLLTVVIPTLEQLQKEGEAGYAKITQYTRYLTVVLAAAQATGYAFLFTSAAARCRTSNAGRLADHRPHAHRRHDAADVDGRADHEARRRQRHLAADLRLDPRVRPGGDQRAGSTAARPRSSSCRSSRSASSSPSSSSRRASGGSRSSTRDGSSAAGETTGGSRPTCRCA